MLELLIVEEQLDGGEVREDAPHVGELHITYTHTYLHQEVIFQTFQNCWASFALLRQWYRPQPKMLYVSVLVYGENIFFAKMLQNPHTRKALVQFNSEMGLTWLIASFWGSFFCTYEW